MKKIVAISFLILFWGCSQDQDIYNINGEIDDTYFAGEFEWAKRFGGSGDDSAQAIINTSDGGFAILGYSESMDGDLLGKTTPVNDFWLLKIDGEGNLEWSHTYGGSRDDRGQSLIQTSDGGYAVIGYAMSDDGDASNNEGFHDNWVLKLDASGGIQWERSFGFSGHDHAYDLVETNDGGFFFVGFLDITSARADGYLEKGGTLTRHGVGEYWATRIDSRGEIIWRRYFGGTNNDRAHSVVQADDGGFVMAGFTESEDFDISDTRGSYDFWVIKVDASGELLWERSFGGSGIDIAQDIAKTADGNYLVTGHTFSTDKDIGQNNGEADVWLVSIDDNGQMLWEETYGGSRFDAGLSVSVSKTGGIILTGNSRSTDMDTEKNAGENDIWVLKTDPRGELLWQGSFGGSGIDFAFDAVENSEKAIILVGESTSTDFNALENLGKSDLIVLKIK